LRDSRENAQGARRSATHWPADRDLASRLMADGLVAQVTGAPLVAGTTPGRTAGVLAAIVAPEPDASFAALGAGGSLLVLLGHRRRRRAERDASQ